MTIRSEMARTGNVQSSAVRTTTRRLQALARLYRRGQASEVMDRTLNKLLTYETIASQSQLDRLLADLREFEQRYGLSSDEFYRRFQTGQTDDRMDYVEWASLVQMAHNLQERLRVLTEELGS